MKKTTALADRNPAGTITRRGLTSRPSRAHLAGEAADAELIAAQSGERRDRVHRLAHLEERPGNSLQGAGHPAP